MRSLAFGEPAPSHGIGAGIGLIYALMLHEKFRQVDFSTIDLQKIKAARKTRNEQRAFILEKLSAPRR